MRQDPTTVDLEARAREPRLAIGIIYPSGSIYLTNRDERRRLPLSNPGLETGDFTGWTQAGGGSSVSSSDKHLGTYAARIVGDGTANQASQDVAAEAGQMFRLVAFLARDSASLPDGTGRLRIQFLDSGLSSLGTTTSEASESVAGWQKITVEATAPASTAWVRVIFLVDTNVSTGAWYFDDARLWRLVRIANVPGNVVHGVITNISSTSQSLRPDERRTTIGTLTFEAVDLDDAITSEIRTQLSSFDRGIRRREVRVFTGDSDDFDDFVRVETYVIDKVERRDRSYVFSCADRSREQRKQIFDRQKTRLSSSITASADTINVLSTTGFEMLEHTASFSHAPSTVIGYLLIPKTGEILGYTGKTATSFTGTSSYRGLFGTRAQAVDVTESDDDKKPRIEEFIYLEMPAPQMLYAIMTGLVLNQLIANGTGEQGTLGSQASSWTNGGGNNLVVANDQQVIGNRSLKITNGTAADSYSYQDVSVEAGATYVLSGRIRTSALSSADAGFGALINVDAQSGITGFTIVEKTTIGSDPSASQPDCGIEADDTAHEWTEVSCRFVPTGSDGTLRIYCQLGYSGTQSGTAWFDEVELRKVIELPATWHEGIDEDHVDRALFESIGTDLYDPDDVTAGLVLRFTHLDKVDGKRFAEEQLHVPMGTYAPIDELGQIELRRVAPSLAAASPVVVLDESTVIEARALEHGLSRVVNQIVINWNYDGERYTRTDLFVNTNSIGDGDTGHGKAPPVEINLRGVHVSRHTRATLKRVFDYWVDRYGAPPIEFRARLSRTVNRLQLADPVRAALPHLPDYAGTDTLDRTAEIQARRGNWLTGELDVDLFASTARIVPDAGGGTGAVIADSWYSAAGTELSTVLTISGGAVTANGSLAGNADGSLAIYYYLGDLTVNAGVTISIDENVRLYVRGALTINGKIDGAGAGLAAFPDPNTVAQTFVPPVVRREQTLGNTRGSATLTYDGRVYRDRFGQGVYGVSAMSRYALALDDSDNLLGLPKELRGTRGIWGTPILDTSTGGNIVRALGGSGGTGGAGLAIVCRGLSFGVSGEIDLSGTDGGAPSNTTLGGRQLYAGAGGGGAPGGLLIVVDGDDVTYPDVTASFTADHGATTQTGNPVKIYPPGTPPSEPWTGIDPGLGSLDMFEAAHLIQYAPSEVPGETEDETVVAPSSLAADTDLIGVNWTWEAGPEEGNDFTELWVAPSNDRTGAVLVSRRKGESAFFASASAITRYAWVRNFRDGIGYSAWHPVSSTAGVQADYGGSDPAAFIYRQSSAPTGKTVGTIWIDTDDERGYRLQSTGPDVWEQIFADDALLLATNAPADAGADVTGAHVFETLSDELALDREMELSGTDYWLASGGTLSKSAVQVYAGAQSLHIANEASGGSDRYIYQRDLTPNYLYVPVQPGETIFGKCAVWTDLAASASGIGVSFYNASHVFQTGAIIAENSGTSAWEEVSGTVTVPAGSFFILVWLRAQAGGSGGDSYFDRVSVRKTEIGADNTVVHASDIQYRQSSDPGAVGAGIVWYDTDNGLLQRRNASNTAWEQVGYDDPTNAAFNAAAEAGATAGATWGTDISNEPTALGDINSGEGTKLTGIESGADVTGDHADDVTYRSSGDPGAVGAGAYWYDTDTGLLQRRNASNTAWEQVGYDDPTNAAFNAAAEAGADVTGNNSAAGLDQTENSFTPTWGTLQFSAGPSNNTIYYKIFDNVCELYLKGSDLSGTAGSSTSMSLSNLPSACRPTTVKRGICAVISDVFGGTGWGDAIWSVANSGSVGWFAKDVVTNNDYDNFHFANSGTKGLLQGMRLIYPLD